MQRVILGFLLACSFIASGCATGDLAADFREFKWHKAKNAAEAEVMCLEATGKKSVSCLKYEGGVCHVVSVDTEKNFPKLGEQVKKCFTDYPPTKTSVSFATKVITYKFHEHEKVISLCRDHVGVFPSEVEREVLTHANGCTLSFGHRYYIYVTNTPLRPELFLLGHEFKHTDQMDWHDKKRRVKPGAFIGTD